MRDKARHSISGARGWILFWRRFFRYRQLAPGEINWRTLQPQVRDVTAETPVDAVYVLQDAWMFKRIVSRQPSAHLDVGSHHKFVSLLAQVVPVTMIDVRPIPIAIPNLRFQRGSILRLPFPNGSWGSVSCLCVVEHIGLGRYGDELDPHGTRRAIDELKRVVKAGGFLFLSVPLDDQSRVYYDAHRALREEDLLHAIEPLEAVDTAYILGGALVETRPKGFCVGCYVFRHPARRGCEPRT